MGLQGIIEARQQGGIEKSLFNLFHGLVPCKACAVLQALTLLHRIAKQVQPVMRKRNWRVPLLSEFSPKSPNLLVSCTTLHCCANQLCTVPLSGCAPALAIQPHCCHPAVHVMLVQFRWTLHTKANTPLCMLGPQHKRRRRENL